MAQFPPIDMAVASPPRSSPDDLEPARASRRALQHLSEYDGTHDRPYCWGFTVFRTVYTPGSDEAVARALERLDVYARRFSEEDNLMTGRRQTTPFDPRPVEDLWSRYYTELIEDEKTLSNASEAEVGERFDAWIREHRATPPEGRSLHGEQNARFLFCLMLDEESLNNILALPDNPPRRAFDYGVSREEADRGWVKVISDRLKTEEEEGAGGRYWLRVGVPDYLFNLYFMPSDPDIMIEELGFPDGRDGVQNLWGTPDEWFRRIMGEEDE